MAFLDHLGMTCQWPTWRSRNLDSETPVPRQVRWFFRPATHISSRSDHLHWHHCQKVTDILTSWWFQTVLIFTTWTDDLFLTRIFQMFFLFHQLFVRSNLTLRWWFSWRRIMEPFHLMSGIPALVSGPRLKGFWLSAMAMIEKDLAIDIELWPVQVQDTKKNDRCILNSYRYTCRP